MLCEAGLRPLHYDIDSARANYHVLLRCRKEDHVTSLAIKHIQDTRGSSQMCTWFRSSMNIFSTLNCYYLLSNNLRTYSAEQQRSHRKLAKKAISRAIQSQFARVWVQSSSIDTAKLSPQLNRSARSK